MKKGRFIKRVKAALFFGLPTLVISYLLNPVWGALYLATLVGTWLSRWSALSAKWRTLVATGGLLIILFVFYRAGVFPDPAKLGSSAQSRLPGVGRFVSTPPAAHLAAFQPPPPDQLQAFHQRFEQTWIEQLARARAVEGAATLLARANSVLTSASAQERESDTGPLKAAIHSLNGILDGPPPLTSTADLAKKVKPLTEFLQATRQRLAQLRSPDQISSFENDFYLQLRPLSVDRIYVDMIDLENQLNQFQRQLIRHDWQISYDRRLTLDERGDELAFDDLVAITPNDLDLKVVDASELLLRWGGQDPKTELLLSYGDPQNAQPVKGPVNRIDIPAGTKQVLLISRHRTESGMTEVPARLRFLRFKYFQFRWPAAPPARVRTTVDVSAMRLPSDAAYAFEVPRDTAIARIWVPAQSYYGSSYNFSIRRVAEYDSLESSELKPSYFATHDHVWIELLPRVFRYGLFQKNKEYLFPENLLAAVAVMFLAAVWGLITAKAKD